MNRHPLNAMIIGCGLIGQKRAHAIIENGDNVIAVVDTDYDKAEFLSESLPEEQGSFLHNDYRFLMEQLKNHIDVVIVATPHNVLAEIVSDALSFGKYVLVEKPAGRHADDIRYTMALQRSELVRVGYNMRFHPAIRKAKGIINHGDLGEIMFIKANYGHGGRRGYENEWRANAEISGGGVAIDLATHLIDLSNWYLDEKGGYKDCEIKGAYTNTYFWDMATEDNFFLLYETRLGKAVQIHTSCTEWRNKFCFEIYCESGKLQIDGIGGSYGNEKLTMHEMSQDLGIPETTVWEFNKPDNSWSLEWQEFVDDINMVREPECNLKSAIETLLIIDKAYTEAGIDYN